MKLTEMDKVEAWSGGAILPPGRHTVKIAEASEGTSTNGYPQIELEFDSVVGAGSIRDWLVVVETTMGKVRQLLDAAGVAPEGGEWEFDPSTLVGKQLGIVVIEEPSLKDPSKMRKTVAAYEKPGSDMPADERDLLNPAVQGEDFQKPDDIPF